MTALDDIIDAKNFLCELWPRAINRSARSCLGSQNHISVSSTQDPMIDTQRVSVVQRGFDTICNSLQAFTTDMFHRNIMT